jgi:hypothetical protein
MHAHRPKSDTRERNCFTTMTTGKKSKCQYAIKTKGKQSERLTID